METTPFLTQLNAAMDAGDIEAIKTLFLFTLSKDVDTSFDQTSKILMWYAILKLHIRGFSEEAIFYILDALIKQQANKIINETDEEGRSLLGYAVVDLRSEKISKLLLESGANPYLILPKANCTIFNFVIRDKKRPWNIIALLWNTKHENHMLHVKEALKYILNHDDLELFNFLRERGLVFNREIFLHSAIQFNAHRIAEFLKKEISQKQESHTQPKKPVENSISMSRGDKVMSKKEIEKHVLRARKCVDEGKYAELEKRLKEASFAREQLGALLLYAVSKQQSECVKTLLKMGADPSCEVMVNLEVSPSQSELTHYIETPIITAFIRHHLDYAQWFLEGFDAAIKTKTASCTLRGGLTLLHLAARFRDKPICQYLIEKHHADVNALDADGKSPLAYLIGHMNDNVLTEEDIRNALAIIDLLLSHGAEKTLNVYFKVKNEKLNVFSLANNLQLREVMCHLLDYQMNHPAASSPGSSAQANTVAAVSNAIDEIALNAVFLGDDYLVRTLLEKGFDPAAPLQVEMQRLKEIKGGDELVAKCPQFNLMTAAIVAGQYYYCLWFFEGLPGKQMKKVTTDFEGRGSYLHLVLSSIREASVLSFVTLVCDYLPGSLDRLYESTVGCGRGKTALTLAINAGLWKVVDFLIEKGAKPDVEGQTDSALSQAALVPIGRRFPLCEKLLRKGANPNFAYDYDHAQLPAAALQNCLQIQFGFCPKTADLFFDIRRETDAIFLLHQVFLNDDVAALRYFVEKYIALKGSTLSLMLFIESCLGVLIYDAPKVMAELVRIIPEVSQSKVLCPYQPASDEATLDFLNGPSFIEERMTRGRTAIRYFYDYFFSTAEKKLMLQSAWVRLLDYMLPLSYRVRDELFSSMYRCYENRSVLARFKTFEESLEKEEICMVRRFFDPNDEIQVNQLFEKIVFSGKKSSFLLFLIFIDACAPLSKEMLSRVEKTHLLYPLCLKYFNLQQTLKASVLKAQTDDSVLLDGAISVNDISLIINYVAKNYFVSLNSLRAAIAMGNKDVIDLLLFVMTKHYQAEFNAVELLKLIPASSPDRNDISRLILNFQKLLYLDLRSKSDSRFPEYEHLSVEQARNTLHNIILHAPAEKVRAAVQALIRKHGKRILDSLSDMPEAHYNQQTALTLAIRKEYWGVVDDLLAAGASVNVKGEYFSALCYAAWKHHYDVCVKLIQHGADINYSLPTSSDHFPFTTFHASILPRKKEFDPRLADLFFNFENEHHLRVLIQVIFFRDDVSILDFLIKHYLKHYSHLNEFQSFLEKYLPICIYDAPNVKKVLCDVIPTFKNSRLNTDYLALKAHEVLPIINERRKYDPDRELRKESLCSLFQVLVFYTDSCERKIDAGIDDDLFYQQVKFCWYLFFDCLLTVSQEEKNCFFSWIFEQHEKSVITNQEKDFYLEVTSFEQALKGGDGWFARRFFDPRNTKHQAALRDKVENDMNFSLLLMLIESFSNLPKDYLSQFEKNTYMYELMSKYLKLRPTLIQWGEEESRFQQKALLDAAKENQTDAIVRYVNQGYRVSIDALCYALSYCNDVAVLAMLKKMRETFQPKYDPDMLAAHIGTRLDRTAESYLERKEATLVLLIKNSVFIAFPKIGKNLKPPALLSELKTVSEQAEEILQKEREEKDRLQKEKEKKRQEEIEQRKAQKENEKKEEEQRRVERQLKKQQKKEEREKKKLEIQQQAQTPVIPPKKEEINLEILQKELQEKQTQLDAQQRELVEAKKQLEAQQRELEEAKKQVVEGQQKIERRLKGLESAKARLQQQQCDAIDSSLARNTSVFFAMRRMGTQTQTLLISEIDTQTDSTSHQERGVSTEKQTDFLSCLDRATRLDDLSALVDAMNDPSTSYDALFEGLKLIMSRLSDSLERREDIGVRKLYDDFFEKIWKQIIVARENSVYDLLKKAHTEAGYPLYWKLLQEVPVNRPDKLGRIAWNYCDDINDARGREQIEIRMRIAIRMTLLPSAPADMTSDQVINFSVSHAIEAARYYSAEQIAERNTMPALRTAMMR